MKTSRARTVAVVGVLALVGVVAAIGGLRACNSDRLLHDGATGAAGSVAEFLARHWADPIAAQGSPPASFSGLEASLDPAACGQCHAAQHADWKTSLHSRAMGPGLRWQLHLMSQADANACLRCHAPLAEQKALLAREMQWPQAPSSPPPAYVPPRLHLEGLTCAACHMRRHQRFGPPAAGSAPVASAPAPHGGFAAHEAFRDSQFCAPCHQFPPEGARLNGKLIENTYEEWRASPAARAGQSCQHCHMPGARHLWRGIHDADMVRQGLHASLQVRRAAAGRLSVVAELANVGAGHHLPTYLIAEIVATLTLVGGTGEPLAVLGRHVIARKADLDLTRELSDTRLAPGERFRWEREVSAPAGSGQMVELRVEVHPGKHYEDLFKSVLERPQPPGGSAGVLLRQALEHLRRVPYESHLIRQPMPAR
ncbi:MAG: hypothetical protein JNL30_06025 [Rubrivivax sp.]|nr:hypothetical protein [Rubrivivax sp.]